MTPYIVVKIAQSQMFLALKTFKISSENNDVLKERIILELLTMKFFLIIKLISSSISYSVFVKMMKINKICRTYICTLSIQKSASFIEFCFRGGKSPAKYCRIFLTKPNSVHFNLICLVKTANVVSYNS